MDLPYHCQRDAVGREVQAVYVSCIVQVRFPRVRNALDMGMGYGALVKKLRSAGIRAYCVDVRSLADQGLVIADARFLPFASETFDLVTDIHMTSDMQLLQKLSRSEYQRPADEAFRVLKKGGVFMHIGQGGIEFPGEIIWDSGYERFYTK